MDISKANQIISALNKFSPEELDKIEDSCLVELTGISKKDIIDEITNLMQQLAEIEATECFV